MFSSAFPNIVKAQTIIQNGDFEIGTLSGWTVSGSSALNPVDNMDCIQDGNYFLATGNPIDRWTISGGALRLNQMAEVGDQLVVNCTPLGTADMTCKVDITIQEGTTAGIRVRSDNENVYSYGVNLYLGGQAALVKFPYTSAANILGVYPVNIAANVPYHLTIHSFSVSDNVRIVAYIDGQLLFDYTDVNNNQSDPYYYQPDGQHVGVTANTSRATFDNLVVRRFSDQELLFSDDFSSDTLDNYIIYRPNYPVIDDTWTGMVTSESFMLDKPYLLYKIAGKQDLQNNYLALVRDSDGAVLFKDTGENTDNLITKSWDVSAYMGTYCHLVIVDNSAHMGAHTLIDSFRLASALPMELDVSILESQIGYHPNTVKHVYLRSATDTPANNPTGKTFYVKNTANDIVYTGIVEYWGSYWGSYWWVLDFTDFNQSGDGYYVTIPDAAGDLSSSAFSIADKVLSEDHLVTVALDQLDARISEGFMGWRDCSSYIREITSMIVVTHGLIDMYENASDGLTSETLDRLITAINRGAQYIVACQREDGRFHHDLYINTWGGNELILWHDAAYAITALVRAYEVTGNTDYLASAIKAYDMCVDRPYHLDSEIDYHGDGNGYIYAEAAARIEYFITDANWTLTSNLRTKERMTFMWGCTLLYGATADSKYLETAIEMSDAISDRQFMDYTNSLDGAFGNFYEFDNTDQAFVKEWTQAYGIFMGYTESTNLKGIMDLIKYCPNDPRVARWYNMVITYAENYLVKAADMNPLGIQPIAAYNYLNDPDYRGVRFFQSIAHGATSFYGMIAKNILEIGDFLQDVSYQNLAESNVQMVAGLNPGIPNAYNETKWEAKSLIKNVGVSSFNGFGGLMEAPDGSVVNGFSAAFQFQQISIAQLPDAPKGIMNTNGQLQFNEDFIQHSHGYVSGMTKLEAAFTLQVNTTYNGTPVAANILINLPQTTVYTTDSNGSLTVMLPTGIAGSVTVSYNNYSMTRPLDTIAGGKLELNVDFSSLIGIELTTPHVICTGEIEQGILAVTNYGGEACTVDVKLLADGATIPDFLQSVTVYAGQSEYIPFEMKPIDKNMPYLVYARAYNDCMSVSTYARGLVDNGDIGNMIFKEYFTDGDMSNWWTAGGSWQVQDDAVVANTTNYITGQAIRSEAIGTDVIYEGKLTLVSGSAVGLSFRIKDDLTAGYDVIIDKDSNVIKLCTRPYSELGLHFFTVEYNRAYTVRIVAAGSLISVYLDDVLVIEVNDERFGLFGFNSTGTFDNLKAVNISEPEPLAPVEGTLINEGFNNTSAMRYWSIDGGTWQVQNGAISTSTTNYITGKAIYTGAVAADFQLEAEMTLTSGSAVGLSFRISNDTGYDLIMDRDNNVFKLCTRPYSELALCYLPVKYNKTYTVRVEAVGDFIKVYLDGDLMIEVTDSTYDKGQFGLFAANSTGTFDNVRADNLGVLLPLLSMPCIALPEHIVL